MFKNLAEAFVSSLKSHPALTVFVVLSMVGMWLYGEQTYAKKSELQSISGGLKCGLDKLYVGALEQSIADVDSELFELQRLHDSGAATERDQMYLVKLRTSKDAKLRELQSFSSKRGNDCE